MYFVVCKYFQLVWNFAVWYRVKDLFSCLRNYLQFWFLILFLWKVYMYLYTYGEKDSILLEQTHLEFCDLIFGNHD